MNDKRQNNQLAHSGSVVRNQQMVLAFWDESRSEAPRVSREGIESFAAKRGTESPAIGEQWMEEVCERENCEQALKRVKANKGSAGVDGMPVQQLLDPMFVLPYGITARIDCARKQFVVIESAMTECIPVSASTN